MYTAQVTKQGLNGEPDSNSSPNNQGPEIGRNNYHIQPQSKIYQSKVVYTKVSHTQSNENHQRQQGLTVTSGAGSNFRQYQHLQSTPSPSHNPIPTPIYSNPKATNCQRCYLTQCCCPNRVHPISSPSSPPTHHQQHVNQTTRNVNQTAHYQQYSGSGMGTGMSMVSGTVNDTRQYSPPAVSVHHSPPASNPVVVMIPNANIRAYTRLTKKPATPGIAPTYTQHAPIGISQSQVSYSRQPNFPPMSMGPITNYIPYENRANVFQQQNQTQQRSSHYVSSKKVQPSPPKTYQPLSQPQPQPQPQRTAVITSVAVSSPPPSHSHSLSPSLSPVPPPHQHSHSPRQRVTITYGNNQNFAHIQAPPLQSSTIQSIQSGAMIPSQHSTQRQQRISQPNIIVTSSSQNNVSIVRQQQHSNAIYHSTQHSAPQQHPHPHIEEVRISSSPSNNTANPIWQQRFVMVYQKFEWFYERYKFVTTQFTILSNDFENVNSEDEWLELKEKHDLLLEKIQQIQQELHNTIRENQELAEQLDMQNKNSLSATNIKGNNEGINSYEPAPSSKSDTGEKIWEHRYHELLEQYQSLSQNYADLQSQTVPNQDSRHSHSLQGSRSKPQIQPQQQSPPKASTMMLLSAEQTAQLQSRFGQLQSEYNVLCDEYEKIRVEYEKTYDENNQLASNLEQSRQMANQLQQYVEELQAQNDGLKKEAMEGKAPATTTDDGHLQRMQEQYTEQLGRYQQQVQKAHAHIKQLEEQKHHQIQQIQQMSEMLSQKDQHIAQLQRQLQQGNNQNTSALEDRLRMLQRDYNIKVDEHERVNQQLRQVTSSLQQLQYQQQISVNDSLTLSANKQQQAQILAQYEGQIQTLQASINDVQGMMTQKSTAYRQLQSEFHQSSKNYESMIRNINNDASLKRLEYERKISQVELEMNKRSAEKDLKLAMFKSEIERLTQQLEQNNRQRQDSIMQSQRSKLESQAALQERHSQIVSRLQSRIHEKEQAVIQVKNYLAKYQRQVAQKDEQLSQLKELFQKSRSVSTSGKTELNQLKEQLRAKQQSLDRRNDETARLKKERQYKIKQINELQSEITELQDQNNRKRQQITQLKKQLNEYHSIQSELEGMRSTLSKKNIEVTELRNQQFQIDRLKLQNQSVKRQLQRHSTESKNRYREIERLKEEIYEMQKRQIGAGSRIKSPNKLDNSRFKQFDAQELSQLKELARKKDDEINRLSHLIQSQKLESESKSRQLDSIRAQLTSLSRSRQTQVNQLKHRVESLQSRIQQSQAKRNQLNNSNRQMRAQFEQQLRSQSQRHKSYYEEVISRHEKELSHLKEKALQQQQNLNNQEIQAQRMRANSKTQELQTKQAQRKLAQALATIAEKQELFGSYREKQSQQDQSHKALYDKISALGLQLNSKEQQIKLTEQKARFLQQKVRKSKQQHEKFRNRLVATQQYENNNTVVQYLSKRIADYQSNMAGMNSTPNFNFIVKDAQANHVFESQVVYQLKQQNDMLRRELQGRGIQHERHILNQLQQQNLKRSKHMLRNSTFSSNRLLSNANSGYLALGEKGNGEDFNFYREKNRQLQERVEKHIQVNKELKQRVESLIKGSAGQNSQADMMYKEQVIDLERTVSNLTKQIEVLTEQNRSMKRGLSRSQIMAESHYDEKVKQLEGKLQLTQKTVQQLNQQLAELRVQYSEASAQKAILSEEVRRLNQEKSTLSTSQYDKKDQQIRQLRVKCQQYQSEIAKLTSKARILQSEIQRLTESQASAYIFQLKPHRSLKSKQLQQLESKLAQLTQRYSRVEAELHEEKLKSNSLGDTVAKWQQKSKFLENQVARLNELNELYNKKQRSSQVSQSASLKQSMSSFQLQISNLQAQLATSRRNEQLATQQLKHYKQLLTSLEYQLELFRSGILEEEALVQEMKLAQENLPQCIDGLRVHVERSLYELDQLFRKLVRK